MTQDVRAIDWCADSTDTVIRKIRAGEGHPGVLDAIGGPSFTCSARTATGCCTAAPASSSPGDTARSAGRPSTARCGSPTSSRRDTPTLGISSCRPSTRSSSPASSSRYRRSTVALDARLPADHTYREIAYEEHADVGYLHFDFYNGAMSTEQCRRLREAYAHARSRDTRVIVLLGGDDYFSNGIHLNVIEAAEDPAAESWRNLNAIDDLVRDIFETDSHLVISALAGDAAAGGVPLALAADYVVAREDVVLNPYYRHMGGLYGSEYWTYLLPRRIGATMTTRLTDPPFNPVGTRQAVKIGLLDAVFGVEPRGVPNRRRRVRRANRPGRAPSRPP